MTQDLGTPEKPKDFHGEQDVVEVRSNDPSNPEPDERWIRSDIAPETNQIATLRTGDGTDIPLFETGTAQETVREARRAYVNGQWGYYPLAPESEAAYPERRVYHDGAWHAYHDRVAPGSAIPDSAVYRLTANSLSASDGNTIQSWNDQIGVGDMTGGDPVYRTPLPISPTVEGDLTDDELNGDPSNLPGGSNARTILIAHYVDDVSNGQHIWGYGGEGSSGGRFTVRNGSGNLFVDVGSGYVQSNGVYSSGDSYVTTVILPSTGGNVTDTILRVNGSQVSVDDTFSQSINTTLTNIWMYARNGSFPDSGATSEVTVHDVELSGSGLGDEEQRVANEWGITL